MEKTLLLDHVKNGEWAAARRALHRRPELSGKEKKTALAIAEALESCMPDKMIRGIGGTGVLALFSGRAAGSTTWLRAELDALPLHETQRPHGTEHPGVAHLCGHDGHMTILLRVARMLADRRPERGRVGLLFQPAEENGTGAARVVKSPRVRRLLPDRIFGLHNLPGHPAGRILVRPGLFTGAVISMAIQLRGRSAHAAEPDKALSPAPLIFDIWKKARQLSEGHHGDEDYAVVTPVHFSLGSKDYGITPGKGEVHLTLRTRSNDRLDTLVETLRSFSRKKAAAAGLGIDIDTLEHFPAVVNEPGLTAQLIDTARHAGLSPDIPATPFRWGEDFSHYLQKIPGCFFGWGAGEDCAPLHHPDYDFPDEQIEPAARFFHELVKRYHG